MIYAFLLKYTKELIIMALVAGLGFMVYNKIVDNTMQKANKEFAEQIDMFNKKLDTRVLDLEQLSADLVTVRQNKDVEFNTKINSKLDSILVATKNKPSFILDTNTSKCVATYDFVLNYNELMKVSND